jgi:apolipoprotein N-acyltransferase
VGIEWFRDLSIVILGFVTTAVLIFTAVLFYRLYRKIKSTLLLVEAASKIAYDTVVLAKEGIKDTVTLVQESIKNTVTLVQDDIRDTVTLVQEAIKPVAPILALIQGIRRGFEGIRKMFEKESNEEGGNSNE